MLLSTTTNIDSLFLSILELVHTEETSMPSKPKIDDIVTWKIFMAVANFGSMNKAAKKLRIDVSSVSRRIESLELALGNKLFDRQARNCVLTAEGEHVIKTVAPILLQFSAAVDGLFDNIEDAQGKIKVSAPDCLMDQMLDWMSEFQAKHPHTMVEVGLTNGATVDLLGGEYDLVIGMQQGNETFGQCFDLGPMPSYICASPDYIKYNGIVESLEDFKNHCVVINSTWMCPSLLYDPATQGAFAHDSGRRFRVENMVALKAAAVKGIGVVIGLPKSMCEREFADGSLVRLMAPMEGLSLHFYGATLNRGPMPPRIKTLVSWIQKKWQENFTVESDPVGRCCSLGLRPQFSI